MADYEARQAAIRRASELVRAGGFYARQKSGSVTGRASSVGAKSRATGGKAVRRTPQQEKQPGS